MVTGGKDVPDPDEEDAGGPKGAPRDSGDNRKPAEFDAEARDSGDNRKPV